MACRRTVVPPRVLAWLFVFTILIYFVTASARLYSYDGSQMYSLTKALVDHHSWVIEEYAGERYSKYGPMQSVLAAPLYAAAKVARAAVGGFSDSDQFANWSVAFFNSIVTSVTVVVMAVAAAELGVGVAAAVATALVWGFATMAWPYAKHDFSEPLLCLWMLLTSMHCLRCLKEGRARDAALAGLFFGFSILTKYANVATGPVFFLAAVISASGNRFRRAAAFAIPAATAVALVLLYNYLRFRNPLNTGYDMQYEMRFYEFPQTWYESVYGVLFSSGKSVFLLNPPLLLLIPAIMGYSRRGRIRLLFFAALCLTYFVIYTRFGIWDGGMAWGPRYHMPVVILGVWLTAPYIDRALRGARFPRCLLAATVVLGILVQLVAVGLRFNIVYDHGAVTNCTHLWFSHNTAFTAKQREQLKPFCGNPILKQEKVLMQRAPRMARVVAGALRGKLTPGRVHSGSYLDFWWAYMLPMLSPRAAWALMAFLFLIVMGAAAAGFRLLRSIPAPDTKGVSGGSK